MVAYIIKNISHKLKLNNLKRDIMITETQEYKEIIKKLKVRRDTMSRFEK